MPDSRPQRSRIVVNAAQRRPTHANRRRPSARNPEPWVAITVIIAAALATFLALFITSRPFDPESASLAPQQTIPAGGAQISPTPKPSPTSSPTPQTKPSVSPSPAATTEPSTPVDDASIQSRIDAAFAADPSLGKLDVSTLVENGKVTIVGSVRSAELKQRVERTIRGLKGVTGVDDQLVVNAATPQ